MSEPWEGSSVDPDAPVTVTLPYRTFKRILRATTNEAYRAVKRDDEPGIRDLSRASKVIGEALGAPPHRRFRLPDKLYFAVVAGDEGEYRRYVRTEYAEDATPVFIDSVDTARSMTYSGWAQCGTAYRRPDFQEVIAAVKSRLWKKALERA